MTRKRKGKTWSLFLLKKKQVHNLQLFADSKQDAPLIERCSFALATQM
jgi:hypothetical protein